MSEQPDRRVHAEGDDFPERIGARSMSQSAYPWRYRRVGRWRRLVCRVFGHRWAFVVGAGAPRGLRWACGRCGALQQLGHEVIKP